MLNTIEAFCFSTSPFACNFSIAFMPPLRDLVLSWGLVVSPLVQYFLYRICITSHLIADCLPTGALHLRLVLHTLSHSYFMHIVGAVSGHPRE